MNNFGLDYRWNESAFCDFRIWETALSTGEQKTGHADLYFEVFTSVAEAIDRQRVISKWRDASAHVVDGVAFLYEGRPHHGDMFVYKYEFGSTWINQASLTL